MSVSIYSQLEHHPVKKFQQWKDSRLKSLAKKLISIGVTADGISAASAFTIFTGYLFGILYKSPEIFIIALWSHVILDGLDGSVARTNKRKRKLNPLVDIAVDYSGIAAASAMAWFAAVADRLPALIFLITYTLVITLTVWRRHIKKPYRLVIRPRVLFYTALTIDIFFFTSLAEPVMWLGTAILIPPALTGLWVAATNLPTNKRKTKKK